MNLGGGLGSQYFVTFDQAIDQCAYLATPESGNSNNVLLVPTVHTENSTTVKVLLHNVIGGSTNFTDAAIFHLAVFC